MNTSSLILSRPQPLEVTVRPNGATISSYLDPTWADGEMRADIRRAFTKRPMTLPPKWLYDDAGSELFEQITRLPEYYQTEAERSLLVRHAGDIVTRTGVGHVVELGSGTSDKTRKLLDAFHSAGRLQQFLPLDVSAQTLIDASDMLSARYPGTEIQAVVGDFTRHLGALPREGKRLVAFLGGTIGNFYVEERAAFLGAMGGTLEEGEWLLLGVDLVKDQRRILSAYNDATGVTEAFIKNALTVLNGELDANFDLDAFDYVPLWDGLQERVDMRLRAAVPTSAQIPSLDIDVSLEMGEELRIEISTKFRPERLTAELYEAGFALGDFWTDDRGDFGLVLARKSG